MFKIPERDITLAIPESEAFLNYKRDELSGGYVRLFEALLILKSPALFSILDEPFSGLMPSHIERLKEIIMKERSRKGIIVTDHLHKHITGISDKLYVLVSGRTHLINDLEQLVTLGYLNSL